MEEDQSPSARSVSARLGVLGRADGSCQWSQGDTSVLVAVWGPSAPKRGMQALPDKAFVDIRIIEDINDNINQNSNLEGRDNPVGLKTDLLIAFKSIILDSLHPRCQISVVVQVIADDGGLLSACVNAITMALIDAGISVSGFITSSTIAIGQRTASSTSDMEVDDPKSSSTLILDPTSEQSRIAHSLLTVAWDQRGRKVLNIYKLNYSQDYATDSNLQEQLFWSAIELGKQSAAKILNFQRQTIKQKVLYEASSGAPAPSEAIPSK